MYTVVSYFKLWEAPDIEGVFETLYEAEEYIMNEIDENNSILQYDIIEE